MTSTIDLPTKRTRVTKKTTPQSDIDSVDTSVLEAYRQLRKDIIRGVRKPDERLRLGVLKSIYGIGHTPLREALQKLSADSLVNTEGTRGFRVASLVAEDFQDLNTARTSIEKEATRLSMAQGDNHWEAQLVAAHYILSKEDKALSKANGDVPDSWELANATFHTAIVSACGSAWLMRVRTSLSDLVERYRRASLLHETGQRKYAVEHSEILDAVLSRDAERACELTERHFGLTAQKLVEASATGS